MRYKQPRSTEVDKPANVLTDTAVLDASVTQSVVGGRAVFTISKQSAVTKSPKISLSAFYYDVGTVSVPVWATEMTVTFSVRAKDQIGFSTTGVGLGHSVKGYILVNGKTRYTEQLNKDEVSTTVLLANYDINDIAAGDICVGVWVSATAHPNMISGQGACRVSAIGSVVVEEIGALIEFSNGITTASTWVVGRPIIV